jgi:hypothetical protein
MTIQNAQVPPSLDEVICGALFEPTTLDTVDFGAFKAALGGEFVSHELLPAWGRLQVEPGAFLPPMRVMLASGDGQWRVQLQRDRVYVNWCRVEGFAYPGLCDPLTDASCVIAKFGEVLEALRGFLAGRGEALALRQVELAKVNLLKRGRDWETMAELGERFAPLGASQELGLTGMTSQIKRFQWHFEPDDAQWSAHARYYAEREGGALHVELESKREASGERVQEETWRALNEEVNGLYQGLITLREV